jgi:hypothetical protein
MPVASISDSSCADSLAPALRAGSRAASASFWPPYWSSSTRPDAALRDGRAASAQCRYARSAYDDRVRCQLVGDGDLRHGLLRVGAGHAPAEAADAREAGPACSNAGAPAASRARAGSRLTDDWPMRRADRNCDGEGPARVLHLVLESSGGGGLSRARQLCLVGRARTSAAP